MEQPSSIPALRRIALIFEAKSAIMAKPHFEWRSGNSRERSLTDDQDPVIWLHEQTVRAFREQVAKARFAGLHEQYIEAQIEKVWIHVYLQLAGLSPAAEQIQACVGDRWTLKKVNDDLRAIKQAEQAALKKSAAEKGGPKATRDPFEPPPLVFGSRGSLGGLR